MFPIRTTRLLAPPIQDKTIRRKRLLNQIEAHSEKKLVLLNASIGYGKTVLLTDFFHSNAGKCAWITCHKDMQDIKLFLQYFVSSFRHVDNSFGVNSEAYLGSSEKFNNDDFLTVFINEFDDSFKENIILIIDDFHLAYEGSEKTALADFIKLLLHDIPQYLKIIISTRYSLPFETGKLLAKRNIWEINTDDLKLTNSELSEISKKIYNKHLTENELIEIQSFCVGWVTALHIVLQKNDIDVNTGSLSLIQKEINTYITEDFFESLEDELKRFLIKTAHLDSLYEEICNSTSEINNSSEILDILYSKNVFLEKISGQEFILHKLFKNFLIEKQKEYFTQIQICEIFNKTAEIYLKKQNYINAIDLFIKSEKYDEAAEILYNAMDGLLSGGLVLKCSEFIMMLEKIFGNNNHKVNYINAFLKMRYFADNNKAEEILTQYTYDDKTYKDSIFIKIIILKAENKILTGDYNSSINILNEMLKLKLDFSTSIEVNYLLGRVYFRKGPSFYKFAITLLETFLKSEPTQTINARFSNIFNILGNIYSDMGKFINATLYYEKIMIYSDDIPKKHKAINNLIISLSYTIRYSKAYEMMMLSDEICNKAPIKNLIISNLKAHEILSYCIGDFESSIKYNTQLKKEHESVNDDTQMWTYYYAMSESYFYIHDLETAKQYLKMCSNTLENLSPLFEKLYRYLSVRISNNYVDSEIVYKDVLEFHSKLKINHIATIFSFVLSSFYIQKGNFLSGLQYLSSSLKDANELSYKYFLLNEIPVSRSAFDFAIANNIEKKFVLSLYDEFREKQNYPWLSTECKLRLAVEIEKLTDIKLLPFGKTELYLRGELVTDDKWIRKKSKILLAYLMSDPEKIHTKDKIMDIFFDDMPADKADVVYHSAIYNIRTALKIYDIKSDKPKRSKDKTFDYNPQYILYEDKTLRLNPDFYYTSDNVEFEKHYNKTRLPALSNEEKITHSIKAIEMYKGDFLPGYYDSWCEELRVKYKNMYITLCEELIKILEAEIRFEEVIKYSELLLKEDKLNDQVHVSIINAYSNLGNIKMAKSRYEIMLKVYDDELGEKPQSKTLEKIKLILN